MQNDPTTQLNDVFNTLKIKAIAESCEVIGPLHKFSVRLEGATSVEKLEKNSRDIALRMRSATYPLVRPNLATGMVDLHLMFGPHPTVHFDELASKVDPTKLTPLSVLVGATEIETPVVLDIASMPHMLIGGTTGSGKTMLEHAIIRSLTGGLGGPRNVRLALIDPKQVEFGRYDKFQELDYDIATTLDQAVEVMCNLEERMRKRLDILASSGCKDIKQYHESGKTDPIMPYVVCIIDEMADLVRAKKSPFTAHMLSIAEKGRAAGIHLIAATQHPSRDVVTGPIKANFPSKIGCLVSTGVHSKVLLDSSGAEDLAGKGDALLIDGPNNLVRFQGALVNLPAPETKSKAAKKAAAGFLSKLKRTISG